MRCLRWRVVARRWMSRTEPKARIFFHWKYSGVIIPTLWGTGVAMSVVDKVTWAYVCFILFGLWSVCYWLTSDTIINKKRSLMTRSIRRCRNTVQQVHNFLLLKWGILGIIVVFTVGCLVFTKLEQYSHEREDAFRNIVIEYSMRGGKSDPRDTLFTVTNNSGQILTGRHRVVCNAKFIAVGDNGIQPGFILLGLSFFQTGSGAATVGGGISDLPPITEQYPPVEKGGDSTTEECMAHSPLLAGLTGRLQCADIVVNFQYYLATQPDKLQSKAIRIVTLGNIDGTLSWHKVQLEGSGVHCKQSTPPK